MVALNSEDKIIKVNFEKPTDDYKKAESLVRQWDKGQYLQITGLDLPEKVQIHFSLNSHKGEASKVWADTVDGVTTAAIPANILEAKGITGSSYCAYAFIYLTDEESAKTVKKIILEVESRPRPEDYVYTETEVKTWTKLEERIGDIEKNSAETIKQAVNDYLEENPLEENDPTVPEWAKSKEKPKYTASEVGALSEKELQSAIDTALTQAKESGEFKGDKGDKGDDGKTPAKGTDYFTEADKQGLVTDVLEALPTWTGGAY